MKPTLAGGGPEALRLLERANTQRTHFALILLDAQMPGMDGFSVAGKIEENKRLERSIVILLTPEGMRGTAARCQELGIKAHLSKPIRRSELLQTVKAVLRSQTIPAQDVSPISTHPSGESGGRLRILLVEDNRMNQVLAMRILEKAGHEVELAENGRVALEILAKQTPDLVLMDVQMPEMDGFQATAAIRNGERNSGKHLPVIALTAHTMIGDKERCLEAGMEAYLTKPLRSQDLFSVIAKVLPIHPGN